MACRLHPPALDHLAQQSGFRSGEVVALRGVGDHVVQLPVVGLPVEVGIEDLVEGHRLVAVVVQRPAAEHLVVLGEVVLRRVGVVERLGEAETLDRLLEDSAEHLRSTETGEFQHCREHVDHVCVLPTCGPELCGVDSCWPRDDHRIRHTALMRLALPAPEGGVARHGPTPRVVVVDPRPADVVDPGELFGLLGAGDVPRADVVDGPVGTTLGAGAVVAHGDGDRVVEVTGGGQEVEQPAELRVGVCEVGGEGLHVSGVDAVLVVAELIPRRNPVGPGRQHGVLGEDPLGDLASVDAFSLYVPAVVEGAAEPLQPLHRGLVRAVACTGGHIEEERLVGLGIAQVGHVVDRVVDHVGGEVVAVIE